jgi:hypothetical protein
VNKRRQLVRGPAFTLTMPGEILPALPQSEAVISRRHGPPRGFIQQTIFRRAPEPLIFL